MAWLIMAEDRDGAAGLRQDRELMARMWAWEQSLGAKVLAAGSLRADDGLRVTGSLMVLDVGTREEAAAIWAEDPANLAGMRHPPAIRFWNPAILGGRVLG